LLNRYSALSSEEHQIFMELQPKFIKDQQRAALAIATPAAALAPALLSPEQQAVSYISTLNVCLHS
jgi:hypothetical protein